MKIEKINDKQIRCTITREDLASRELKLSDLAYGSEKTKALFQDMMQMALQDFGFEADNIPLVIEAIPLSMDALVLIITKVDDPEELDTRFARFSQEESSPSSPMGGLFSELKNKIEGADDILGLFKKISDAKKHAESLKEAASVPAEVSLVPEKQEPAGAELTDNQLPELTRFYLFHSLDNAISAAAVLADFYDGPNSLFKDPETSQYYLLLKKADTTPENFNKICNILSEYALACKYVPGLEAHFGEHTECILKDNALQSLAALH